MKKKFDWRRLFLLSYYYTVKKGHEFNAFTLFIDVMIIWMIILTIIIGINIIL